MTNILALEQLLSSLFTAEELRRHLAYGRNGAALLAELPGQGTPLAQLVHATVSALTRRGELDPAFFNGLREARPARSAEIDRIESARANPPVTTQRAGAPASGEELRALRQILVRLAPAPGPARRLAVDAGLDPARIDFAVDGTQAWFNVIEEAKIQGLLPALVAVACDEFPAAADLRAWPPNRSGE